MEKKLYAYAVKELNLTTVKRKRSGGQLIMPSRIYEILKDSIYAGYFEYGGQRYELDRKLPRIINETQRNRVLQLLSKKNIPKIQHHESTYSGFIQSDTKDFVGQDIKFQLICDCKYKFAYRDKEYCPHCGRDISTLEKPKYMIKTYYYNVRKKKFKLPYKCLSEDAITDKFNQEVVENLDFSNSLLDWSKKYIHELKDKELDENILVQKDRMNRKEEFESKKRKMREMLRDENITNEEYVMDLEMLKSKYKDIDDTVQEKDFYTEMMDIVDVIEKLQIVMKNGDVQAKRNILSRLGSNLVWNDEILNIYNKKSIQILIDGIKRLRKENPKFEPKKYVVAQGLNRKNQAFDPVFSTMLDIAREIGTFWKTNKAHIWIPNIKQGFFGIVRPTAEEMRKYK